MSIRYTTLNVMVIITLTISLSFGLSEKIMGQTKDYSDYHETAEEGRCKSVEQNHDDHGHHDAHDDHSEHKGHDAHGSEETSIHLSAEDMKAFGMVLATATIGSLQQHIELPGEVAINEDRLAHVTPWVSGVVRDVFKDVGESVEAGELLAILDSRDLAEAKAAFLAAIEYEKLARATLDREERLWQKNVTSEQDYLDACQSFAAARIVKNTAEQQLHALGVSATRLDELQQSPDSTYTRFEIRAPFAGTVIKKHLILGEYADINTEAFVIADLSVVWVNIAIYQKDLSRIRKGQEVIIDTRHDHLPVTGKIAWISPLINETTRTANARVILPNASGNLRPGLFVTARVVVGETIADVVIPKSALQTIEDRTVVFVQTPKGLEPQFVTLGRQNSSQVEILSGLEPGQSYVSKGAFTLKAQLSKGAFDDGHNH